MNLKKTRCDNRLHNSSYTVRKLVDKTHWTHNAIWDGSSQRTHVNVQRISQPHGIFHTKMSLFGAMTQRDANAEKKTRKNDDSNGEVTANESLYSLTISRSRSLITSAPAYVGCVLWTHLTDKFQIMHWNFRKTFLSNAMDTIIIFIFSTVSRIIYQNKMQSFPFYT